MLRTRHLIQPLDPITRSRITSSVHISSLTDVVLELVKNAVDAQANKIHVTLNYAQGSCSIIDNGHGIPSIEFQEEGNIGRDCCTSKNNTSYLTYGRHGQFLAALAGVALVSIVSKQVHSSIGAIWLSEHGRKAQPQAELDAIPSACGTRIRIWGLFSSLPVRTKHLAARFQDEKEVQREFGRLKHELVGILLNENSSVSLKAEHLSPTATYEHRPGRVNLSKYVDRDHIHNGSGPFDVLKQARYTAGKSSSQWHQSTIKSSSLQVDALVCSSPVPHRNTQFIFINKYSLAKETHGATFEQVNSQFLRSDFGTTARSPADHHSFLDTNLSIRDDDARLTRREKRKGVDRWPMFVIGVQVASAGDNETDSRFCDDITTSQTFLSRIEDLIGILIAEFLSAHGFNSAAAMPTSTLRNSSDPTCQRPTSNIASNLSSSSRTKFDDWSRMRSSHRDISGGLLGGLPFRPSKLITPVNTDRARAQDSLESKRPDGAGTAIADTGPEQTSHLFVKWNDPHTGQTLRVNNRTGMVQPAPAAHDGPSKGQAHPTPLASKPCTSVDLAKVALSAEKYRPQTLSHSTIPVRSGHPVDHLYSLARAPSPLTDRVIGRKRHGLDGHHCTKFIASDACDSHRLSRSSLQTALVLGQVDRKFIMVLLNGTGHSMGFSDQLVLIDQHAADERCKVEGLINSILNDNPIILANTLTLELSSDEFEMLQALQSRFRQFGIEYDFVRTSASGPSHSAASDSAEHDTGATCTVCITALPSCIAERCCLFPQLLKELLREECWKERPTPLLSPVDHLSRQTGHDLDTANSRPLPAVELPQRLVEMINSRACRSAIMFNDELSLPQCRSLVQNLARCNLPFQCAHGRPSMTMLADLGSLPVHNLFDTSLLDTAEKARYASLYRPVATMPGNGMQKSRTHTPSSPAIASTLVRSPRSARNEPVKIHADIQWRQTLNIIDHSKSFGDAYRAWIASNSNVAEMTADTPWRKNHW